MAERKDLLIFSGRVWSVTTGEAPLVAQNADNASSVVTAWAFVELKVGSTRLMRATTRRE